MTRFYSLDICCFLFSPPPMIKGLHGVWMYTHNTFIHRIHSWSMDVDTQNTSISMDSIGSHKYQMCAITSFLKNMRGDDPRSKRFIWNYVLSLHKKEWGVWYNIWYFVFVVGPVQLEYININKVGWYYLRVLPNGFSHGTSSSRFFSAKSTNKKNLSKRQNARSIEKVKQACS